MTLVFVTNRMTQRLSTFLTFFLRTVGRLRSQMLSRLLSSIRTKTLSLSLLRMAYGRSQVSMVSLQPMLSLSTVCHVLVSYSLSASLRLRVSHSGGHASVSTRYRQTQCQAKVQHRTLRSRQSKVSGMLLVRMLN